MNVAIIHKISGKIGIVARKYGPEILMGAGVVSFGGSLFMAGRAGIICHQEKDNYIYKKALIDTAHDTDENYPEETYKKETRALKFDTTRNIIEACAPAVGLGAVSLGCFCGTHYILRKRNIALVAAYKVLSDNYKEYRGRVIEAYGEEVDWRFKNGVRTEKETITEVDEDGKKHKKKVDVNVIDTEPGGYSYIYDDKHCMGQVTDSYIARTNLEAAQASANVLLKNRGYILLNEVLRMIGLHESSEGSVVGWQMKGNGDGFVDFRIQPIRTNMDVEGPAFLLDFNVDGVIYQDIDKYTRLWEE